MTSYQLAYLVSENKVVTTMMIRPFNDRTYCARSATLRSFIWVFGEICTIVHGITRNQTMCSPMCCLFNAFSLNAIVDVRHLRHRRHEMIFLNISETIRDSDLKLYDR